MQRSNDKLGGKKACHFLAQRRQEPLGEPGVLVEPSVVAPGWVRQRHDFGVQCQAAPPVPHGFSQTLTRMLTQMPMLGRPTKANDKADLLEVRQELCPPSR